MASFVNLSAKANTITPREEGIATFPDLGFNCNLPSRLRQRGYAVPPIVQGKWAMAAALTELTSQPDFPAAFLPQGRTPAVGGRFRFPDAARSLRLIAESRGEAFYRGGIATALARAMRRTTDVQCHGTGPIEIRITRAKVMWILNFSHHEPV